MSRKRGYFWGNGEIVVINIPDRVVNKTVDKIAFKYIDNNTICKDHAVLVIDNTFSKTNVIRYSRLKEEFNWYFLKYKFYTIV